MFLIIGSILGGYVALGGKLAVLWQPFELVIIGGSGVGANIIANSAQPFNGLGGRTNWELSLDRANAARRALVQHGIPLGRISNVIGRADRELLDAGNPESPANRRITVTLLRAAGKEASKAIPEPPLSVFHHRGD